MVLKNIKTAALLIGICILNISCSKEFHLAEIKDRNYRIEKASYPVDVHIASIIEPYKVQLDKTMNEVIGYSDEELVKGKPASTLTNWFCDVLLDESQKLVTQKIDFALQNYGGIRVPFLSKGNITVGTIYELMPFDNVMFIMELKGDVIQQFFDKMAASGGWPVSRGVYFEIAYGAAKNIKIGESPLDPERVYIAAVPDYIANGGDNMVMLLEAKSYNTGVLIRDLLINNIKENTSKGLTIKPNNEKRITE
ncbi:MAG: 5'-nucleotidase C-terminal domain-containing protein [Saprospiraceae bacterium]|jgi:2',3'-cyclic-nucleotide 2'-phosphodiesterase (5'-nucleotidase family)